VISDLLPDRMFGSEAVLEILYPANLRFFDRAGELAHGLEPLYNECTLTPQSHIELEHEGAQPTRVDPSRVVVFQAPDEDPAEFLARAAATWTEVSRHLDIDVVDRVGARSAFLVALDTAEEAVKLFRDQFFEYYEGCLEGLGKPTEVQAMVRFAATSDWEGVPLSVTMRVSPIHLRPELQDLIGEYRFNGGLLIDMDRYAAGPLEARQIDGLIDFAFSLGISTAAEVGRRLGLEGKEVVDDSTRANSA
jgi:hypothetical protein